MPTARRTKQDDYAGKNHHIGIGDVMFSRFGSNAAFYYGYSKNADSDRLTEGVQEN